MTTSTLDNTLAEEAAKDLLGVYRRPGGWATGGFRTKLIEAWNVADNGNHARLSKAFPELGFVIELHQAGFHELVQNIAEGSLAASDVRRGLHTLNRAITEPVDKN